MIFTTLKKPVSIFIFLLFQFCSCKVTFLSAYDEVTDKTLSDMQQSTTAFFIQAESDPTDPDLTYNKKKKFYEDLKVKSRTLRIRNNSIEKNKPMIGMLDLLDQNIITLENLHKQKAGGLLSAADIALLRSAFEQQFTAMFKFILGLKARDQG